MNSFLNTYTKNKKSTTQIKRKKDIIKPNMIDACLSVWLKTKTSGVIFG